MSRRAWYWRSESQRALGLQLKIVRRNGDRAWWLNCRACDRSVLCLKCEDCQWEIEQFPTVAAHIKRLKIVDVLFPFRCATGCNDVLCDGFPSEMLLAMAVGLTQEGHKRPARTKTVRA